MAVTLGALAAADLAVGAETGVVVDRYYAISGDLTASIDGLTAGEGPIRVGVAHSDYTAQQIEDWIENSASWDEGDLPAQEITRRKIRELGTFGDGATNQVLNDGKPQRIPLRMTLTEGDTLQSWAYNESSATLTTGSVVEINGKVYLRRA